MLYLLYFRTTEKVSIYFSFIESEGIISTGNEQSFRPPLADEYWVKVSKGGGSPAALIK
jgi:hypothetical protein